MSNNRIFGLALVTLTTLGLAAHPATAQQLVTNGGFEQGTNSATGQGNATGWTIVDNSGTSTGGAFQTTYTGDIGTKYGYTGGVAPAAQGSFAAFINNNLGGAQTGGTSGFANGFQYLGVLVGGTTYTVTGLVGNRSDNTIAALGTLSLVQATAVGGTVTSTSTVFGAATVSPTSGTFASGNFTFTATAAQTGTPFGIKLSEAPNTTGTNAGFVASQVNFDNISVIAAAPEPSQYAGLGLGVLGLAGLALKARRRQSA